MQSMNNLSALSLERYLGMFYRTAWRIEQKFLVATAAGNACRQSVGLVMADDVYFAGVHASKAGGGS